APLTVRGCLFIRGGDILKLREVDPVLISEVMRNLDMLLKKRLADAAIANLSPDLTRFEACPVCFPMGSKICPGNR
ncbi:MAG: hypothetical protein K2Z81_28325, partial [Cyanobacteria bacterium]|nr:hypothetical protein [Cyanobacteriota bacterium]